MKIAVQKNLSIGITLACILCAAGTAAFAQAPTQPPYQPAQQIPPSPWGMQRRFPPPQQPQRPITNTPPATTPTPAATTPPNQPTVQNIPPAEATPPLPPVNPAQLKFENGQLTISANDASLRQIFHDTVTLTGIKVLGHVPDQRVYGTYGPAAPEVLLGNLLDGSGYNFVFSRANGPAGIFTVSSQDGSDTASAEDEEPATPHGNTAATQPTATTSAPPAAPSSTSAPAFLTPQQVAERIEQMHRAQQQKLDTTPQN